MLIAGAKGHAKEILDLLKGDDDALCFFDNISDPSPEKLYSRYKILRTKEEVVKYFKTDNRFAIGVGNPIARFELSKLLKNFGGELTSVISKFSLIGSHGISLGKGLNLMHHTLISNDVSIGEGTLINTAATIHHDSCIGKYCDISPGARILGGVKIGNFCSIGSGAIVLPKIKIGNNVIVGAGAVVNKNLRDNCTAFGVPVKIIKMHE